MDISVCFWSQKCMRVCVWRGWSACDDLIRGFQQHRLHLKLFCLPVARITWFIREQGLTVLDANSLPHPKVPKKFMHIKGLWLGGNGRAKYFSAGQILILRWRVGDAPLSLCSLCFYCAVWWSCASCAHPGPVHSISTNSSRRISAVHDPHDRVP